MAICGNSVPELEICLGGNQRSLHFDVEPRQKLSRAIWLSGLIPVVPLCGGLRFCGRCRCHFLENPPKPAPDDIKYFSQEELAAGWRLSCRHIVPESGVLRIMIPDPAPYPQSAIIVKKDAPECAVFLGYDLGTTTIQWQAVTEGGEVVAEGTEWNPQAGAGADIVSRLAAAMQPEGMRRIASLAQGAFLNTVASLNAKGFQVARACVAANSAMIHIFLRKNISGLVAAPYSLSYDGNDTACLRVSRGENVQVYIPPLPAPFVGADISSGIFFLLKNMAPKPFLLLDLGTNAELALLCADGRMFLGSAPLGPAMEGVGPQCGQPAATGVITAFKVGPAGLVPVILGGKKPAVGISATGYISLLAQLLAWGIMDKNGQFCQPSPGAMPLARRLAAALDGDHLNLPESLVLTRLDVEMLLKVKAVLSVSIARILKAAGIKAAGIARLYLAGALGMYANIADLTTLGFLPRPLAEKAEVLGNASLKGACLLARSPGDGDELATLCQHARIVNLANDERFLSAYLADMVWGAE